MLPSGQVVELTNLVTALEWSDQAEEISQRASITLANTKTEQGYLSDILKLCTPIYIFANGKEVFRGIIWEWAYKSALEKEIRITAYNQIIKSTKSKDNNYYTAGKSTQDIVTELCGKWGIALKYNYGNHTHPKLVLNNQAISAPDVPQIRKGDKIKVAAGNLSGFFYVKGVSHSATERTMEMELKR